MRYKHATYPVSIYIYKGLTEKQVKKTLNRESKGKLTDKFLNSMSDMKDSVAHVGSNGSTIVIVFSDKKPTQGVVVHEACHAMFRVFEFIQNDYTEQGEEAYAYLIQELVNKINEIK